MSTMHGVRALDLPLFSAGPLGLSASTNTRPMQQQQPHKQIHGHLCLVCQNMVQHGISGCRHRLVRQFWGLQH